MVFVNSIAPGRVVILDRFRIMKPSMITPSIIRSIMIVAKEPDTGILNLCLRTIDLDAMRAAAHDSSVEKYEIPLNVPLIINPRGFRPGSVHQDVFFQSIPLILREVPEAHFICPGMRGQPQAEKWLRELGIDASVSLLPFLSQSDLWALYSTADVYISLSSHDGTPNSFLEAIDLI